jgi:hypothetical protein
MLLPKVSQQSKTYIIIAVMGLKADLSGQSVTSFLLKYHLHYSAFNSLNMQLETNESSGDNDNKNS